jgi:hypothetical protein
VKTFEQLLGDAEGWVAPGAGGMLGRAAGIMAGRGPENAEAPFRELPGWASLQRADAFRPEEAVAYRRERWGEEAQA